MLATPFPTHRTPSQAAPPSAHGSLCVVGALGAALLLFGSPVPGQQLARGDSATGWIQGQEEPAENSSPFEVLDNIEGDRIDLAFAPVNPMVFAPDGTLFALNTHASRVVRFDGPGTAASASFPVPWGPVSLEHWVSPDDGHAELLVVSRGTYALTRLDPDTGRILGHMELPAEPGGIVLDRARGHLFVACSALDVVVEIDLRKGTVHDRFEVATSRHLLFLSLEPGGDVLVAPMISGNNSLVERGGVLGEVPAGPRGILDLDDPTVAITGLPDQDLFRIRPSHAPFGGSIEVVATGLGTNLFAHGIHPETGRLWILNTEANNKNPAKQNEHAVRGEFVTNRLTITDLPVPGAPPVGRDDHEYVLLDDADPATPDVIDFAPGHSLGKPYGLTFSVSGIAFVVGVLTDNVRALDWFGNALDQWDLPQGSIPRAVRYIEGAGLVAVYCWGTNKVELYAAAHLPVQHVATFDLGYDPAPAEVRAGREIFFDGHNSLYQNASCESCHLEGGSDFLAWNLSDWPVDDKGPMVTQSLRGIEPLAPYHWRGERSLTQFNGAFGGLLGGEELDLAAGAEFDLLERYLFQLQNPANPFEHPDRIVSDAQTAGYNPGQLPMPAKPSGVRGQDLYYGKSLIADTTCNSCHALPTGTLNDWFTDGFADQGQRTTFVIPGFNAMWRKEQKARVDIQLVGSPDAESRPPLGTGPSHAGTSNGIFEFIDDPHPTFRAMDHEDIALFVHQLDSGLAPAVHRAALMAADDPEGSALVTQYLLPQTLQRNCDLAVLGTVDLGAGPRNLRWVFDRSSKRFLPEDSQVGPVSLAFFQNQALTGKGQNLFVALPLGMARRFAVDADGDGLFDLDELSWASDPTVADTDHDGFLDGAEVAHGSSPTVGASTPTLPKPRILRAEIVYATARIAKLVVETQEPARLEVDFSLRGDAPRTVTSTTLRTLHTIYLKDLEPSHLPTGLVNLYEGQIRAYNEAGTLKTAALPKFETKPFANVFIEGVEGEQVDETFVAQLRFQSKQLAPGGGFELEYFARIEDFKLGLPVDNNVAIARVLVKPVGQEEFVRTDDFTIQGAAAAPLLMFYPFGIGPEGAALYAGIGPFAVGTVSDAGGTSYLRITLPHAQPGDQVRIAIENVGRVDPLTWDPTTWDTQIPEIGKAGVFYYPVTAPKDRVTKAVTL